MVEKMLQVLLRNQVPLVSLSKSENKRKLLRHKKKKIQMIFKFQIRIIRHF